MNSWKSHLSRSGFAKKFCRPTGDRGAGRKSAPATKPPARRQAPAPRVAQTLLLALRNEGFTLSLEASVSQRKPQLDPTKGASVYWTAAANSFAVRVLSENSFP